MKKNSVKAFIEGEDFHLLATLIALLVVPLVVGLVMFCLAAFLVEGW